MAAISTTIPAADLPPDFDPQKPLKVRSFRAIMPAFDRSKYAGLNSDPKDPDDPDTGGGGSVSGRLDELEAAVEELQYAKDNATIEAVCNEDGTITVTLNWGVAP